MDFESRRRWTSANPQNEFAKLNAKATSNAYRFRYGAVALTTLNTSDVVHVAMGFFSKRFLRHAGRKPQTTNIGTKTLSR